MELKLNEHPLHYLQAFELLVRQPIIAKPQMPLENSCNCALNIERH